MITKSFRANVIRNRKQLENILAPINLALNKKKWEHFKLLEKIAEKLYYISIILTPYNHTCERPRYIALKQIEMHLR